jgi:hypothetical protein
MPFKSRKATQASSAVSLVAVDEGLVLGDVEGIRGRHREEVVMDEVAPERLARHADGRFQKPLVANVRLASVELELLLVDPKHVFQGEKGGLDHLASF